MFRKTLIGSLAAASVVLALSACSNDDRPETPASVVTEMKTVTATPTSSTPQPIVEAPIEEPAPAPVDQPSFTCGDLNLYQRGTAIYSDGTTGYEQACDAPGGTNPYGPNTRGDATPAPGTYVPDSGDGYGPNQVLPPLCVRFPDTYGPCPGQ